ncbi:hypothetical protein [Pararhizobium gei]|uniref:hypothetical protein n=1 Tax=Pararhizobium gei TaxID=1395951 RepID=UPI0023DB5599|nr:hypothetical protein [Rhizobium gei]
MLSSDAPQSAIPVHASQPLADANPADNLDLTMDLMELELSLDGFSGDPAGFADHVRRAASAIEGVLLFELPASGLIADSDRIAVLRIPQSSAAAMATIFACLGNDGSTIRVEQPDEATVDLKNFAEAFVDVLQRI